MYYQGSTHVKKNNTTRKPTMKFPKISKQSIASAFKTSIKLTSGKFFGLLTLLLVGAAVYGYFQLQSIQNRFNGDENWIKNTTTWTDEINKELSSVKSQLVSAGDYVDEPLTYTILSTSVKKMGVSSYSNETSETTYADEDILVVKVRVKNVSNTTQSQTYYESAPIAGKTANGELISSMCECDLKEEDRKDMNTDTPDLIPDGTSEYYLFFKTSNKKIIALYIRPQEKTVNL